MNTRPRPVMSGSSDQTTATEFPAHPRMYRDTGLDTILSTMRVRAVSAILYQCGPGWAMADRRIADDMLFLVIHGRGRIWVEDRECALRPGVCAHFRRGVVHAADTDPGDPIEVISIHYEALVYESLSVPALLRFPDTFTVARDGPLTEAAIEACRIYQHRLPGHRPALDAIVTRLLLSLIWEQGDWLAAGDLQTELADLHRLQPALEMMRRDLAEPPAIGRLARAAGLSEPQFRRVFQRGLGMAPVAYLRRLRIEEACRLLRHTNETVESISARVGYAEPSFFARTFKELAGTTPGRYRRTIEL